MDVADLDFRVRTQPGGGCRAADPKDRDRPALSRSPWCGGHGVGPFNAVGPLATIGERQGEAGDAIALLRIRELTSVNGRDQPAGQLADPPARHAWTGVLGVWPVTEELSDAAHRLAELLEERGDVEGAVALYRQAPDAVQAEHGGEDRGRQVLGELDQGGGAGRAGGYCGASSRFFDQIRSPPPKAGSLTIRTDHSWSHEVDIQTEENM
ncbi:tetratricopeptide repeat protein [Kitasatospora sp. NPDC085464]|uniref:tetratricopeptide repeat protein n=1 Tax=Kitasatospora sp. NPDC085464 TaxID=3364063 RepID=UPI0037C75979